MQIITISSKNQITIPANTLRKLDFGKKAILETEDGLIKIKPIKGSIVDELSGSLKKFTPKNKFGKNWEDILKETKKATVKKLAEK